MAAKAEVALAAAAAGSKRARESTESQAAPASAAAAASAPVKKPRKKAEPTGFYAVTRVEHPAVYTSWVEAEKAVKGVKGAVHQKFQTLEMAQAFLKVYEENQEPEESEPEEADPEAPLAASQ